MSWSLFDSGHLRRTTLSAMALSALAFSSTGFAVIEQSGEQKNMQRVGHTDLQGRSAYQPNIIVYPDGRTILFVGTHNGNLLNPLTGRMEQNGTLIIDVTDPAHPVEKAHIPQTDGQSQNLRMCLARDLPSGARNPQNAIADRSNVYLLRNIGTGYETWNVTNVSAPVKLAEIRGVSGSHKHWWECSTGLLLAPGSRTADGWRQDQSMLVYDWKNPKGAPNYIRTFGLPGGQPSGTGPVPTSLHGPISTVDHPQGQNRLARGATDDDIISNRLYLAYGVGDDGVFQILDRKKLLPPASSGLGGQTGVLQYGGTWDGSGATDPTDAELLIPQAGILHMSPDQGGHTAMPVFGMEPPSYQSFNEFTKRDIVLLASESTSNRCNEAPHWTFIVDVTVENSLTVPPGTSLQQNPWQGPMILSTMSVDPRLGENYPRGNYCTRGARFGVHSSEENFTNPFYGRLTFIAYFTGGVRAWDIREPHAPVEVGFYVPVNNALTTAAGYMTNNLEVDDRGYIYIVDRSGAGMDIIRLTGQARRIGFGLPERPGR